MTSPIRLFASDDTLKSVTIFKSDRAEVTRAFTATLEDGQNNIEIVGLSSCVEVDSVRVTGLGDARLFEASCKLQRRETWRKLDPSSDSERIRVLNEKKALLQQEKAVCENASSILRDYGKSLSGEHITPADADKFLDQYLARGSTLARNAAKLDGELLMLQREIDDILADSSSKMGSTDGQVNVTIMAKTQTEIILKLVYVVRQARWKPSYELHAYPDKSGLPVPSVSLHYRAMIVQGTGENWEGVALTLSTASPSLADESIPELKPTRISPPRVHSARAKRLPPPLPPLPMQPSAPPPPPTQIVQLYSAKQAQATPQANSLANGPASRQWTPPDSWAVAGDDEVELVESISEFESATSIARESPLFVSYTIDGKSSIPSDGEAHKVSVAEIPFEARVSHVVVPKVKAIVYLEAKVKNTSDYRLMPGPVNVFFDDSYVSQTSIKDIAPGGEFTCTLGPDMGTRVSYKRTSKLEKEAASRFAEQFSTTAYTALTTVTNTHPFALGKLIVRDGLPISDDGNRVRVILREPSVLAEMEQGEEKNVGEHRIAWSSSSGRKEGLYEWHCSLGASKEIALSTSWDVKAPADVSWVES
ncbi:unnamed protein product [Peniophora sp. CBMAI 1063]|nr:unnamed protein product [Peniophora sp. CBMAI 1063]